MARSKGTELSVFKGREAKLNRAIFQALALKSPQTIYDIHKQIRRHRGLKSTKYASVNKRMRILELSGYVRVVGVKRTRAGFKASLYESMARAHLVVILDSHSISEIVKQMDETAAFSILASIIEMMSSYK